MIEKNRGINGVTTNILCLCRQMYQLSQQKPFNVSQSHNFVYFYQNEQIIPRE